jgi:hypothetical protein
LSLIFPFILHDHSDERAARSRCPYREILDARKL